MRVGYEKALQPGNYEFTKLHFYSGGRSMRNSHKWARIDKYAVRGAMRWVYNNQQAARQLG